MFQYYAHFKEPQMAFMVGLGLTWFTPGLDLFQCFSLKQRWTQRHFLNLLYKHFIFSTFSSVMLGVVSAVIFVVKKKKSCAAAANVYFIPSASTFNIVSFSLI